MLWFMRAPPPLSLYDLLRESDAPPVPGYEEWKRAKIERVLDEMKDESTVLPAGEVWRKLGLET